jgi:hypothetical protein
VHARLAVDAVTASLSRGMLVDVIGVDRLGASTQRKIVLREYRFTVESDYACAKAQYLPTCSLGGQFRATRCLTRGR